MQANGMWLRASKGHLTCPGQLCLKISAVISMSASNLWLDQPAPWQACIAKAQAGPATNASSCCRPTGCSYSQDVHARIACVVNLPGCCCACESLMSQPGCYHSAAADPDQENKSAHDFGTTSVAAQAHMPCWRLAAAGTCSWTRLQLRLFGGTGRDRVQAAACGSAGVHVARAPGGGQEAAADPGRGRWLRPHRPGGRGGGGPHRGRVHGCALALAPFE